MSQGERKKAEEINLGEFDPLSVLDGADEPEEEFSVSRARESLRVISGIASSGKREDSVDSRTEQGALENYQDDLKSSQVAYARYQAWRRDQALDMLGRVENKLFAPGRPLSNQDLLRLRESLSKEVNDSTQNIDRVIDGPPVVVDNRSINVTVEGASKEDRASRAAMLDLLQAIDIELSSIISTPEVKEEESSASPVELIAPNEGTEVIEEGVILDEREESRSTDPE
jgi:hypothetical protein